ncbi:hypothetical protein EDC01DRAFT_640705 [Geopyxis carbonaria]|nr:hypothetical protein EDC01DRAFT_640705 [Geopyxis carbonaria]
MQGVFRGRSGSLLVFFSFFSCSYGRVVALLEGTWLSIGPRGCIGKAGEVESGIWDISFVVGSRVRAALGHVYFLFYDGLS